jgi:hypothetical protein
LTLRQALSKLHALADFIKSPVALFEESKSKRSHANLYHSSVVADLVGNLLLSNDVSKMRLEEKVLSLVKAVVEGMVIDLKKDGLDLHLVGALSNNLRDELFYQLS